MTDLTNKDDYLGYIKIWCSVLTHTQFLWLQLLKPSTRQHMTTRHRMSPKTQWHSAYPQIQHVETWRSMARLRTSHNHSMTFGKSRSWPASSHIAAPAMARLSCRSLTWVLHNRILKLNLRVITSTSQILWQFRAPRSLSHRNLESPPALCWIPLSSMLTGNHTHSCWLCQLLQKK
jgi:hypothetical protein